MQVYYWNNYYPSVATEQKERFLGFCFVDLQSKSSFLSWLVRLTVKAVAVSLESFIYSGGIIITLSSIIILFAETFLRVSLVLKR